MNQEYEFQAYVITHDHTILGPYGRSNTIRYMPVLTVCDSVGSDEDLVHQVDYDFMTERELVIRWHFNESDLPAQFYNDYHIYVKGKRDDSYHYLGRPGRSDRNYFIWKEGTQVTAGDFINGPQHGERYTFRVYAISDTGVNRGVGPFDAEGAVSYLVLTEADYTPTATPTVPYTPTPTITPTLAPTCMPDQPFIFSGYVKSFMDNQPVAGAKVMIGDTSTITDPEGYFAILIPHNGPHVLHVEAAGFTDFVTTHHFQFSNPVVIRLRSSQTVPSPTVTPSPALGFVYGYIYDAITYEAVADATVTINHLTVGTDVNGFFILTGVPMGEQRLQVVAPDYELYEANITIGAEQELLIPLVDGT